ncbi:MAG: response regulator [Candidatus Dadabacteria bacterium]|nr:response regulator [Candidatus Dadabacteria bacterium]NIS08418.1 response regulator [Candidatus Dadabacteria bacterium]NIV41983.1 response regulator [Candidatus Dadabacteria bacterium]NIX15289.1 response regulator [Candidatus Dadabacteria bacterium]NIY21906.1 response regulator [Candidatus Dadabacteria bacterium]
MDNQTAKILIVDDEPRNRLLLNNMCENMGFETFQASNGLEAVQHAIDDNPDLIIMDVIMPKMNGFDSTEKIKSDERTKQIPVIIVTALGSREDLLTGISKGADDFLTKPYDFEELAMRIKNNLKIKKYNDLLKENNDILEERVQQRTQELQRALFELNLAHDSTKAAYLETIYRLTLATEFKDQATGSHIKRISLYTRKIAEKLSMNTEFIENIFHASPMHDIGKVGIPDSILLKPGALNEEEWEVMKTHTTIGAKILEGSESSFLKMGQEIARNHHETWNGTGYPNGLSKTQIPISARITIIADQYDALRSSRPYKEAFTHEQAFKIITEGDGRTSPDHFDPDILKAFIEANKDFREILESFS